MLAGARGPVCVYHLEPTLGLAQPTVSYHLKLLLSTWASSNGSGAVVSPTTGSRRALDQLGDLVRGPTGAEVAAP